MESRVETGIRIRIRSRDEDGIGGGSSSTVVPRPRAYFGNDLRALPGTGLVSEKQPAHSPTLPALAAFQCHQHHQHPSAAGGTMTPKGWETRNGRNLSGEGKHLESGTICREGVFLIRIKL